MSRKYFCLPDNISVCDKKAMCRRFGFTSLPSTYHINVLNWRRENQQMESSCTGYASTLALEYLHGEKVQLSPLFVYWFARKMQNELNKDDGARLIDVMKVLANYGVCEERYHKSVPNTNRDVFVEPSRMAMVNAEQYKIKNFYHLMSLKDIKKSIASGVPVIAGVAVFNTFENMKATRTGIIDMPSSKEKNLGGHAITFVGYDDKTKYVKFFNSWGIRWGDRGCGYLPYEYVNKYCFSAWQVEI